MAEIPQPGTELELTHEQGAVGVLEHPRVAHETYRVSDGTLRDKDLPFRIMTNIPEDYVPFERQYKRVETVYLRPEKMDELAPGHYEMFGMLDEARFEPGDEEYDIAPFLTELDVIETKYGIAYKSDQLHKYGHQGIVNIDTMRRLGFAMDGTAVKFSERILAKPSPETFKRAALEEFGVKVRLVESVNGQGKMSVHEYLDAFKAGEYPVQVNSESYYHHDISEDHAFAIMLGGNELMAVLAERVAAQLDEGRIKGNIVKDVDQLTFRIGLYLEHPSNTDQIKHIKEHAIGLGIPMEVMQNMLKAMRAKMIDNMYDDSEDAQEDSVAA